MIYTIRKIGYTLLSRHFYIGIAVGIMITLFALPQPSHAGYFSEILDGQPFTIQCEPSENEIGIAIIGYPSYDLLLSSYDEFSLLEIPPTGYECTDEYTLSAGDLPGGDTGFTIYFLDDVNNPSGHPNVNNPEYDPDQYGWYWNLYFPIESTIPESETTFFFPTGPLYETNCVTEGGTTTCSFLYATSSAVRTEDMFYLTILFLTGTGVAIYLVRKLT